MQQYPTQAEIIAYITQSAQARGIDPRVALTVASGEGLNARPQEGWQSFVKASGGPNGREDSWGIYQLLMSHKGKPGGVGYSMLKNTGIDPRNPSNWRESIDYALDYAAKNGWSAWYGAKAKDVANWDGLKGAKALGQYGNAPANPDPIFAAANRAGRQYPDNPGPTQTPAPVDPVAAELSATADNTQQQAPAFPASKPATPSKSPQEIYAEYLTALRSLNERRTPRQPLKLQIYDNVRYDT